MEKQLAQCYPLIENKDVSFPPVRNQTGEVDCGLFAIAYAFELAAGNDPTTINFDQSKMRQHLLSCLEREEFTSFPSK
jgi:polycystin 1L2